MRERDIMVSPVRTVKPDTLVKDVARLFLEHRISAAPVVDNHGKVVGIITSGIQTWAARQTCRLL